MSAKKLVVANWKMNGGQNLINDYAELFSNDFSPTAEVAACVPYPFISSAKHTLEGVTPFFVGAQDLSVNENGAYTGEVSASMLSELAVRYVIVGHSERREYHAESDALIADKTVAALRANLSPILCVGESLEVREAGHTLSFVKDQLDAVLKQLTSADFEKLVIAYEPIWAIGTGVSATTDMVAEAHSGLREMVIGHAGEELGKKVPLLYGGSVNDSNAADIFSIDNVEGGLVGGASLKPAVFREVCLAAS